MTRLLLGMETEYAVATDRPARAANPHRVAEAMLEAIRIGHRPWMPEESGGRGVFLANGARLYVDRGAHPEYATPECSDPWQATAAARAGDLLLLELLTEAERITPMARTSVLLRSAVDYGRTGATWGCHESYLHRVEPTVLPDQLVPHLVSRVVYAGAGGFHPCRPGIEFTLSPRAALITEAVSGNSTHERGIYHTKDESLSGQGWHRMHVICGDSLCSDLATVLKLGTTALVLAAVDAGRRPGYRTRLVNPIEALHRFAGDPACRERVPLREGKWVTAVELQRYYLGHVEACRRDGLLPEWAGDLCALWRRTLDALERRDTAWLRGLDWPVKLEMYRGLPRRERDQMLEADLRFGQLGPHGVYTQLAARNLVARLAGPRMPDPIALLNRPPSGGRARVRGEAVAAVWARGAAELHRAQWNRITELGTGRMLDLGDPHADRPVWIGPDEIGAVVARVAEAGR